MDKKAFSVAEAMISLLIGSLALGAAAPMITKQLKQNNFTDAQIQILERRIRVLENNNNSGIPKGTVAFFDNTVEAESTTNPCPKGWAKISSDWNGRFPRFSGSYTVYNWNWDEEKTKGIYTDAGESKTLLVGEVEEDAIRNIAGSGPAFLQYGGYYYVNWYHLTNPFYKESSINEETAGAGNMGNPTTSAILKFSAERSVPVAVENRPKSVALLGCRKL